MIASASAGPLAPPDNHHNHLNLTHTQRKLSTTSSLSPQSSNNTAIYPSSFNESTQEHRSPSHAKHDSKVSIATKSSVRSTRSHKEYIDSLEVPCKEELARISTLQERKEEEHIMRRLSQDHGGLSEEERIRAAALIQRNFRGHRERRMLEGMSLDPSTRWIEAIKEARYRNMTQPRARASVDGARMSVDGSADVEDRHIIARQNWKKIGLIARRAGADEDSESRDSEADDGTNEKEREERRKRRMEEKRERQKAAKMMDLQYFLEMVDLKHR